eukprot:3367622-Pleurochrysis_carterae.AAC.1
MLSCTLSSRERQTPQVLVRLSQRPFRGQNMFPERACLHLVANQVTVNRSAKRRWTRTWRHEVQQLLLLRRLQQAQSHHRRSCARICNSESKGGGEHLGIEHAIPPVLEDGHCQFHAIVACLMHSSQRFATTLVLLPEIPPKSSALQYRFQIAQTLARIAHLKLGGDEPRAGVVTFAESMCNEIIAKRKSYPNESPKASWMQGASTSRCICVDSSLFPRRCITQNSRSCTRKRTTK